MGKFLKKQSKRKTSTASTVSNSSISTVSLSSSASGHSLSDFVVQKNMRKRIISNSSEGASSIDTGESLASGPDSPIPAPSPLRKSNSNASSRRSSISSIDYIKEESTKKRWSLFNRNKKEEALSKAQAKTLPRKPSMTTSISDNETTGDESMDASDSPISSVPPSPTRTTHSTSSESLNKSPVQSRKTIRERVRTRRFLFATFRSKSRSDIPTQDAAVSPEELEEISASVLNPIILLDMILYSKSAISNPLFEQSPSLKPEQTEFSSLSISSLDSSNDTPMALADWKKTHLPPAAAAFYPPRFWVNNVITEITNKMNSPTEWSLEDREYSTRYVQVLCDSMQRRLAIEHGVFEQLQNASRTCSDDDALLNLIEQTIQYQKPCIERVDGNLSRLQEVLQQILSTRTFTRTVLRGNAEMAETVELDEKGAPYRVVVVDGGEETVVAGSGIVLANLILNAISTKDKEFVQLRNLLATFRIYFKPPVLLGYFNELLDVAIGNRDHATMNQMDSVLKYWSDTCWRMDFVTNGLMEKVKKLAEKLVASLDNIGLSFVPKTDPAFLQLTLEDADGVDKTEGKVPLNTVPSKSTTDLVAQDVNLFMELTENVEIFATFLANQEFAIFRSISIFHLVEKLFTKSKEKVGPLLDLINWSNRIGYWIGANVCVSYDLKKRIKVLTRFIEIAKCCWDLQSYNTAFAMVAALQGSSIMRLQKTWEGLSRKTITVFDELEQLCNPQGNYRGYRSQFPLPKATYVPYLGVHLRDITYLNDGTPSKLPNGLYNFEKYRKLSRSINHLLSYQNQFFHVVVPNDKVVKYIKDINTLRPIEERHLYRLSCLCETPSWRKKKNYNHTALETELAAVME